ncbi:MAG TPA: aminotransferase class IV [Puia sp.]|nr:aminotransferase class IV [Puia sp.]
MNPSADWINHNGVFLPAGTPVLTAGNRGFRYGDGLFETLLIKKGQIRLRDYHFHRLFTGIDLLRFTKPALFTPASLEKQILRLCERNDHTALARVRLVVFRGDGGLYDPQTLHPHYLIESWPLRSDDTGINENGLVIDIYPDGQKPCDPIANCKSNNFLLYVLAALYAKDHRLNDCLVLNSHHRLADSTIANLFYVKQGQVFTPPLSEGCVAGVMRRFLLATLPGAGFPVHERPVTAEDLLQADEVFLTNAIKGIRWVREFRTAQYASTLSGTIYRQLIKEM